MRIGLLTTSFPRWEGDVAGSFVLGFARALALRGHHIDVLAPEPARTSIAPHWPGIEVQHVPYLRPASAQTTFYGAGVPDNVLRDPRAVLGLLPFVASLLHHTLRHRARWDALVSHFALPCGLCAALLRERRPHLSVFHSADLHLLERLPGRALVAQRLARGASHLSFVSSAHRDRFLQCLEPTARTRAAAHSHVQAMGIDPPEPCPRSRSELRAELGLQAHDFALLTIGRLIPVKGLTEAVQALAQRADLLWLIAGEGPEAEHLSALARRVKLRVRLLGHVTGSAKARCLRAADAFVLPSRVLPSGRSEGVPTAVLEAMAHALPVVAADVGGLRDIIDDGNTGLSYPAHDARALEAAIDRLRLDAALRAQLSVRAQQLASQYHWAAIAPRLEALLRHQATSSPDASPREASTQTDSPARSS